MKHQTSICTLVAAWLILAATNHSSSAAPKPAVAPPSLSKLSEASVMAPLPDGRLLAVLGYTKPSGHEAVARYSSDGGRTWSETKTLFTLSNDMGIWGAHYVLVDSKGEVHLFYTADAKTAGKPFYQMRFDVYHVGSTD